MIIGLLACHRVTADDPLVSARACLFLTLTPTLEPVLDVDHTSRPQSGKSVEYASAWFTAMMRPRFAGAARFARHTAPSTNGKELGCIRGNQLGTIRRCPRTTPSHE